MKNLLLKISILVLLVFLMQGNSFGQTGTWTQLTNNEPNPNMGAMVLLTDGTVICHNVIGGADGYGTGWDKLTPSATGSYLNGTWTTIASMNQERYVFPSQVLPSGKVWVAGGEYGVGDTAGEVYDPVANKWTRTEGVVGKMNIYDGNSELLPDGNILVGLQDGANPSFDCQFYTPSTNKWSTAPIAPLDHDEAAWLKLPDSSILFVGINTVNSCRYRPQTNTWIADANLPDSIFDEYGGESGSAHLLPNGKAIFFGATGHNVIYTPSGGTAKGTWARAADFPILGGSETGMVDAPSIMLPNGHILMAVSPIGTSANDEFRSPTYFVEYNYVTNTFAQVTSNLPSLGQDSMAGFICQMTLMLLLPDGTVLMGVNQVGSFSEEYYIYTEATSTSPIAQGKPTITSILPDGCPNYKITGKLFNGISEGSGYGDDWQNYTNYPLVRLTNAAGNVYYCKTTNWNRLGAVMTDSLKDTAVFTTPATLPAGTYSLVVIANGFASNPTIFKTLGETAAVSSDASCGNANGSASTTGSGGISPYTYLWTGGGGTNATATGLSAGTYTVTITDNNGCTATVSVTITQSSTLGMSTSVSANVKCNGLSDATATATVSGGSLPYTYSWTGGKTTATVTGLSAGTYTVSIADHSGCSGTVTVVITQPTALSGTVTATANANCGGSTGSASSTVSGGTSPYTYAWTGGGTNSTVSGLSAGTYTLNITDNNGCTHSATVSITQTTTLSNVSANATVNVKCNGQSDGTATASTTSGTSPYTYLWTGGKTTATVTGLSAGMYTVTVTDKNGCDGTASVTITQPTALSGTVTATANANCGGSTGSASSTVSGGTSPYTYAWTGGGTNSTVSGLSAGTYTLNVTDNNGCTHSATVSITQTTTLSNVSASATVNVKCNGQSDGTATASITSGTSPYTYLWTGGKTTATVTGLSAGTYTVTVTDKNGCDGTASVTITQPTALSGTVTATANANCGGNTGSASSTVSGGTSPYTYAWTGGGTNSTVSGLSAGIYTLNVTDNNGCTYSATVSITQTPGISEVSVNIMSYVTCNGLSDGNAMAIVSGGTTPYTYTWTGGETNSTVSGLSAGTYILNVIDNNGCSGTASVIITQPGAISITTYSVAATNAKDCDGEAAITVSGGTLPYTYSWSGGAGTADTIKGQCAGNYCCTITDNNGCTESTCITITANSTGVVDINNTSNINIYPQPNSGSFTVAGVVRGQVIELYNILGQQISSVTADQANVYFNITNQADGIYLVRILNKDGSLVTQKKIVKAQ